MQKTEEFMKPELTFGKELRFTPYAWAKLIWMRDRGTTEVAGYCVTGTEDPLLVTDFILIKQECTMVTFKLDPEDSVEYMEKMMDTGLPPWAFSNILAHTHPGNSPNPSQPDEDNFVSAFSHPDWAIMFIVAEDGSTYCRLKMNVGPGATVLLKSVVEYGVSFAGSNTEAWEKEYKEKVGHKVSHATLAMDIPFCQDSQLEKDLQEHEQIKEFVHDALWYDEQDDKWTGVTEAHQDELAINDLLDDMDCYWSVDGHEVVYWDEDLVDISYHYNPDTRKWYEDDGENRAEIPEPNGPIVSQIAAWAKKFDYERPEVVK
jgi:proteasome lid subunit RPN8/RPN11